MQSNPQGDLDLPLKVPGLGGCDGRGWVGYTAPADLVARYQIVDRIEVVH